MQRLLTALICGLLPTVTTASLVVFEPEYEDLVHQEIDEQMLIALLMERESLHTQFMEIENALQQGFNPEVNRRLRYPYSNGTGLHIDWESMTVEHVTAGSPAAIQGISAGDKLTAVGEIANDGSIEARLRMQWALLRNNIGDVLDITTNRDSQVLHVHLNVLSRQALNSAEHQAWLAEMDNPQQWLEAERHNIIEHKHRAGARQYAREGSVSRWDGVTFLCIDGALAAALGIVAGATVIEVEAGDHPLMLGDVIIRVGTQSPKDGQHLSQLLYDFDGEPLVPIHIKRGDMDLLVELPYPQAEKIEY